jgi:hypothetical protein
VIEVDFSDVQVCTNFKLLIIKNKSVNVFSFEDFMRAAGDRKDVTPVASGCGFGQLDGEPPTE